MKNTQESEFFARQLALPKIGPESVAKLQSSTVAVVGTGGVGSAAAYYLSTSMVGSIRLIDQDIVETSNLARLHGADFKDLYKPKAEVLARTLSRTSLRCKAQPIVETLTNRNIDQLLINADLIVDGLDNFRTRYIVNKYASRTSTPYLFTSSVGEQAHLALYNPPSTDCLQCTLPGVADRDEESCANLGVAPTSTALTGALAASATVRFLLGLPTRLTSSLLTIDLAGPDFLLTKRSKNVSCNVCGEHSDTMPDNDDFMSMLCGGNTVNVLPTEDVILDLQAYSLRIASGTLLALSDSVLIYREGGRKISLFRDGRVMVNGVATQEQALTIALEARQKAFGNVTH
ncbi:MAG TPA: ThiF family adenylyltransferase [Candidatus Bathyarchaeia archaeon]|nr:ThiF family adenylyltransferase [Candidatus Bathyarchaeia archaeon]